MSTTPRPLPLVGSLTVHGLALGWLVWNTPFVPREKPHSLYAQVIEPNYPKLVWYTFREKLPDVAPTETQRISLPPEARVRTPEQEIVSRPPDAPRARQMVWEPAPKIKLNQEVRLPNLLIMETAPPPSPPPKPRLFVPPREQPQTPAAAAPLDAPPEIATAAAPLNPLRPELAKPQPRALVLPARVLDNGTADSAREAHPDLLEAPRLNASATATDVQKVVVGLAPAARLEVAPPEGSRPAAFSAGPELRAKGGGGSPAAGAQISVPGLLVRGGGTAPPRPLLIARSAPTSAASLAAALHMANPSLPAPAGAAASREEPPPDPSFAGRLFYRLAIQMPNVTSYSGSWTIWLAEHDATPGTVDATSLPEPLHKVDPKYFPSAMDDRVEGKVRLRGIIGADGHVAEIVMLEKLDDRLDQSSMDALRRWEFTPATRNGRAIAMDMVVEIPFRLRPEKGK